MDKDILLFKELKKALIGFTIPTMCNNNEAVYDYEIVLDILGSEERFEEEYGTRYFGLRTPVFIRRGKG